MLNSYQPFDSAENGAARLDPLLFREGMSRVAAAVHVVTTDGAAGRAGFTATAVTPVTDTPPSLLVCINAAGRTARSLTDNGVFCVNTLGHDDLAVADTFAGRSDLQGGDRFSVGQWGQLSTGAPLLTTSLVAFDCRLTDARLVATHHVIIGEIVAIRLGRDRPALVYRNRAYHAL
jgi:flavin reductase (DIM6/NTAB) family NADH-FMN oxidoreductase RutF